MFLALALALALALPPNPHQGGGLLSELQIASRIRQLALFDEPALVLPL